MNIYKRYNIEKLAEYKSTKLSQIKLRTKVVNMQLSIFISLLAYQVTYI
jgi:hypothetical protein